MNRLSFKSIPLVLTIVLVMLALFPMGSVSADALADQAYLPSLADFSASVENSNAYQVTGIFVRDVMALPVVQQPSGQAGYVSTKAETVTQFAAASKYGTTGLLAHNYLAGTYFSLLSQGEIITLVYGDGHTDYFRITAVKQYQALSPSSPYSNFVDLAQPGYTLSSTDLFYQTYGLGNVLILQTCIAQGNESSWGRLFIIAEPIELLPIVQISIHKHLTPHLSIY